MRVLPVDQSPIRVLHVLRTLSRGGAETWLLHVLRHLNQQHVHMDFLVQVPSGHLEEEARTYGARVIPCPTLQQPWRFTDDLAQICATYGPYDIIHSHVHHYSGVVLRAAARLGIPGRIAHSHSAPPAERHPLRRAYISLMLGWIRRYATSGLAASHEAAEALFGADWPQDHRWRILFCGIDSAPFHASVDSRALRRQLGIPDDAFVLGHVGRMVVVKNHTFLVKIVGEMIRRHPKTHLVCVGAGPLQDVVQAQAERAGLAASVHLLGDRNDVPQLMCGVMDAFLLPSLYEGLPLVCIEAQAAGLPMVISEHITAEIGIVPSLVHRLPVSSSPVEWADEICALRQQPVPVNPTSALQLVEQSPFTIQHSVRSLEQIYDACSALC